MALQTTSRSSILAAATDLFVRKGFHGTGIRELSKAVGLGSGALYHHIGSKEQLLFEITMSLLDAALEEAKDIAERERDPEQSVRALARALLEHHAAHGDAWSVALHESGSLSEEHQRLVLAARDEYEHLWRSELHRGAREGRWRQLRDVEVRGILGMLNSVPRWMRANGAMAPAEIADCFLDLAFMGIEPHGPVRRFP